MLKYSKEFAVLCVVLFLGSCTVGMVEAYFRSQEQFVDLKEQDKVVINTDFFEYDNEGFDFRSETKHRSLDFDMNINNNIGMRIDNGRNSISFSRNSFSSRFGKLDNELMLVNNKSYNICCVA